MVDVLINIDILLCTLNEQIRYLSLSKIKSVYILLQFHRKYKLSEIFTWVGKFVILCVQVLCGYIIKVYTFDVIVFGGHENLGKEHKGPVHIR